MSLVCRSLPDSGFSFSSISLLEFFCKEELSLLPCVFTHSVIYIFMESQFKEVQGVILSCPYFVNQVALALAAGNSRVLL